jgi:hypothetical protein
MNFTKTGRIGSVLTLTVIVAAALSACGGGEDASPNVASQSTQDGKARATAFMGTVSASTGSSTTPPNIVGGMQAAESGSTLNSLKSVLTSSGEYRFTIQDLGEDEVAVTAERKVGDLNLTIQIMAEATASLNRGAPELIRTLMNGQSDRTLTVSFTGMVAGLDATRSLNQVAIEDAARQLSAGTAPADCGRRTHHAAVQLSAPGFQPVQAIVGLWASKAQDQGTRGRYPDLSYPDWAKPCPDRKSVIFLGFEWPELKCGTRSCALLTHVKVDHGRKINVDVKHGDEGTSVGGGGETHTITEEPIWVAGHCSKKFVFWGWPNSYYYCKCEAPTLPLPGL